MEFEKNTLLFGADSTPRIVAIELGETGTVKVYRREKGGSTVADVEPFHPFVWADSDVVDLGIESEKLQSDLKYGWLITVDSWKELIALRNGLKNAGRDFFAFTDPVQHYLTATGRTLFKELEFEELKRMQVEVLPFEGAVAGDGDPGNNDHIMSIALSDNRGWEELIVVDPNNIDESERNALRRLTALIKERDPDVIEGHNLFRFDLPYLVDRAKKLKTKLDWGRSGGFLRSRPSRLQIAEKTIDYPKFNIDGRHFVDTFLFAQFYDVGMRSLSGFDRIDVARHFGFCASDELSALAGKELQRAYIDNDERFRQRARCAVRGTRAIADLLSPSYFIQAQIFPYNYQDVIVRGNATRINALFLREYFWQRHSIPEMPMARTFEGGYTDIFFTGVARNIWHCDVASLYPSIMLQFACFPATDQLQIFRHLLTDLRTFRLEAKAAMRAERDPAKQHHLHALQTKDGDVIIKGGALKSRGLEKFPRVFLEEMIKLIMEEKAEAIPQLRNQFEQKIRNREWNIDMLMRTDTLQDSLDKYRAKIAGAARNRAAPYELALASGRNYKPGDQVSYYIKTTPKKVPAYEAAKFVSEFDPQNPDENVDYYVAKLNALAKKFASMIPAAEQETLRL